MKQNKPNKRRTAGERVYALFLHVYPRKHRQAYGPLMLQAFRDSYRDARETEGRIGLKFWLDVVGDEVKSISSACHFYLVLLDLSVVKKAMVVPYVKTVFGQK